MEKGLDSNAQDRSPEQIVRAHVLSVLDAMLTDAGFKNLDREQAAKAYTKFEVTIKSMRSHLLGIKDQNYFLMKTRTVA